MTETIHPAGTLKAIWSHMQFSVKLLFMLGVMAVLIDGLAWEEESCGAERVAVSFVPPLEILGNMSVAEVEQRQTTTIKIDGKETTLPFGFINDEWEELKRRNGKRSCIYHYRLNCGVLCGSEGYLLIRDGQVVYLIQTKIS